MQNYQHAKRSDSAKARINKKRIMQHKQHGHAQSSSQPTLNCTSEYNSETSHIACSGSNFMTPFEDCQSPTNQSVINTEEIQINDDTLKNLTLIEIEQLLHINQRSLKDYPTMPYPQDINLTSYLQNNLLLSELDYNHDETRSEFKHLFASMTGNIPIHTL
ncbi:hypothetical protein JHK84_048346 [Glycine max]|nr:hypothetical protein JHK86_048314 [Glycine max]KAG5103377.1 hypothetical protein JHK84_048346 [Glycine max]